MLSIEKKYCMKIYTEDKHGVLSVTNTLLDGSLTTTIKHTKGRIIIQLEKDDNLCLIAPNAPQNTVTNVEITKQGQLSIGGGASQIGEIVGPGMRELVRE
jgi:aspartate carbamoyltransferase regulatory subunit